MASSNNPFLPQQRGLLTFLIDRVCLWFLGFPPERCSYTTQSARIPISDGLERLELACDLLQPVLPDGVEPVGTVLQTSPYGRGFMIGLIPRAFAARGYQVLLVSSRGTFGSGGEFDPFRTDVKDGKRVVEWMRKQSWYTGTFATIGGSYLAFNQWALLVDPPKDMVAAVTTVSVHDASRAAWETGALNLDIVRWADHLSKQEESMFTWKSLTRPKFEPVVRSVPLAQNVRRHFGDQCHWVDDLITKSDMRDPYYAPMQLEKALERANIPILIVTGWYDIFHEQSVEQYLRLKDRNRNVAMTSGPWSHIKCALGAQANRECFDWIEEHLGGRVEAQRKSPVDYFVTGLQRWRSVPAYPPSTTSTTFYLQEGGGLATELKESNSGCASFTFDPNDPTPTIGGNALAALGAVNDGALAKRKDVLVFETTPLNNGLEFCGKPTIELAHSTSHPFADIFVRVSDVKPNGKSTNVTEAYKRLDPKRSNGEVVKVALNNISHRFLCGRRIRVVIAGGNFPQYARNLGLGDETNTGSEMRSVEHTIHFGDKSASKIYFPVVDKV
jgi:putative CocE/NonD family hydrolase